MKIVDIKVYKLFSRSYLLRVITDDGLEGIGQFISFDLKSQLSYLSRSILPLLKGKNPNNISSLWELMYWTAHGRNGWIQIIAAIDIALHDILGKNLNLPLWKYFGSKSTEEINMYWSMGHGSKKTIGQMAKDISKGIKMGFKGFKIRMDWHEYSQDKDPKKDFEMAKHIKSIIPKKSMFAFDANAGYSAKVAIEQSEKLNSLNVDFFEEPVNTSNLFELKKVIKNSKVPISFGEYEMTNIRFKEIIKLTNLNILQPDILNVGGLSEMKKVYDLGNKKKKIIIPHSPDIGVLSIASLHLFNSNYKKKLFHEFSDELCDKNIFEAQKYYKENILPKKGKFRLNSNPGLGLTVELNYLRNKEIKID
jgi:L-alanine-DL-glutamate epimerase-like enolase superfamily enzyme